MERAPCMTPQVFFEALRSSISLARAIAMELAYENTFITVHEAASTASPMRRSSSMPVLRGTERTEVHGQEEELQRQVEGLGAQIGLAKNVGSQYHPELCSRPCAFAFGRGCPQGHHCKRCHLGHSPQVKLDKKQRAWLTAMDQAEIFCLLFTQLSARAETARATGLTDLASELVPLLRLMQPLAGSNIQSVPAAAVKNLTKYLGRCACKMMICQAMSYGRVDGQIRDTIRKEFWTLREKSFVSLA